jgi:hypothetical protein
VSGLLPVDDVPKQFSGHPSSCLFSILMYHEFPLKRLIR